MNGLQVLPQWELAFNHPVGGTLGLLSAIQNIGSLGSLPFSPYMNDGVGRKMTLAFGAIIMVFGAIIQTAAQNVRMFIGARFLIGFGLGFAGSAAPLLVTEIAYPSQRGQLTSVYNSLWPAGAIIAAWTTFGTFKVTNSWSWRVPSAVQAASPLLQVFFVWFVPESPRWYISKGRYQDAIRVLGYYHGNGDEDHPLVKYEIEEIKTAIELDRAVEKNVGWLMLIKTPGNRKRMRIIIAIAFFSQWSGNGLVSYYLNKVFATIGITDPTTQLLINAFLSMWGFIMALVGSFLCDRLGRRVLFITSTAGMMFFFMLQTICSAQYALHGNKAAGNSVVAFIFLFGAAYSIAYSPLIVTYTVEILPYQLRAKGFSVFAFAVTLSLIFNQYVNPIALLKLGWKYYIVFVVWDLFELIFVYFFIIETRNRTLEETAALFDGKDHVAKIAEVAAARAGLAQDFTDVKGDEKGSVSGSDRVQTLEG